MVEAASHADQIAASAAHAAWVSAAASALASMIALGVAVWSARRDETRRRQLAKDKETAFAFGMVGALEMAKPLVSAAQNHPDAQTSRRKLTETVEHALTIAEAALSIQVFDMQLLRDAYLIRGVLNAFRNLPEQFPGELVPNQALLDIVDPVLGNMLDADDRFFARLTSIGDVQGVDEPTHLTRPSGRVSDRV